MRTWYKICPTTLRFVPLHKEIRVHNLGDCRWSGYTLKWLHDQNTSTYVRRVW